MTTVDVDFASVRVLVDDLSRFSLFFILTDIPPRKVCDPRVGDLLLVTAEPVMVFADAPKTPLLKAFHELGVTCLPHENPNILSKVRSRRMDCELLQQALHRVGVTHVFVYVFGTKSVSKSLMDVLDETAARGGAEDNCFHIGRSVVQDTIPLFHVPQRNKQGQREWNFSYLDFYPLFKHLGKGFGSLEFRAPGGNEQIRVRIYQLWIHWVKAALKSDLVIPHSKAIARSFKRKYENLFGDLEQALRISPLGGHRVEVVTTGSTISSVIEMYGVFCSLDEWTSRGLNRIDIEPAAVIAATESAFSVAKGLGVFRGDSDCSENEKIVFVDLCNLLGISVSQQFNPMLARTGVNSPPEAVWRTLSIRRRVVRAAIGDELSCLDRNLMASWLKYRVALNGGYTLSLRKGGGMWEHRWWVGETCPPESDMRRFLLAMVKLVEEHVPRNWKKLFILRNEPRSIEFDLNSERYENTLERRVDVLIARQYAEVEAVRAQRATAVQPPVPVPNDLDHVVTVDEPMSEDPSTLAVVTDAEPGRQAVSDVDSPSWVVRPVSQVMLECIRRVASIRYSGLRTPWETDLDTCMLEYVYQRERAGYTQYKPSSEGYWLEACRLGLSQRGADTLRGRWKLKLAARREDYFSRRDSEQ